MCPTCTHRVNELQHDEAAFALKSEYENVKNDSMEYNDEVDVNSIDDPATELNDSLAKKERAAARASKTRSRRRFGYDQMRKYQILKCFKTFFYFS